MSLFRDEDRRFLLNAMILPLQLTTNFSLRKTSCSVYDWHVPSSEKPYRLDDSWAVLAAIDGHLLGTGGLARLVSKVMTFGESTCAWCCGSSELL
jgi:hypothetical protein